jgi:transcriptional regulator with XRE-family HTH domain
VKLSQRIREAREAAGLSQAELAKKLRVASGTVAGWETGSMHGHGLRPKNLKKVARVLKLDYDELVAEVVGEMYA